MSGFPLVVTRVTTLVSFTDQIQSERKPCFRQQVFYWAAAVCHQVVIEVQLPSEAGSGQHPLPKESFQHAQNWPIPYKYRCIDYTKKAALQRA